MITRCVFHIKGPALVASTDKMFELSKSIKEYYICPDLKVDISKIATSKFNIENIGEFTVQIIDSVKDYSDYMKEIFDFNTLKALLTGSGGKPKVVALVNALSGGKLILKVDCGFD